MFHHLAYLLASFSVHTSNFPSIILSLSGGHNGVLSDFFFRHVLIDSSFVSLCLVKCKQTEASRSCQSVQLSVDVFDYYGVYLHSICNVSMAADNDMGAGSAHLMIEETNTVDTEWGDNGKLMKEHWSALLTSCFTDPKGNWQRS